MLDISVIIPVYNAAEFLEKSVLSALALDEVKEVILVEDQSTDDSLEICKKLAENYSKIKLFQHPDQGNHGAAASRNLGIEKAGKNFITFLDADDYYLPNRFEAEKDIFKDPKTDAVFGAVGIEYLTEKGKQEFQSKFSDSTLTTVNYSAEGKDVFRGLLGLTPKSFGSFFHLNALTIRKSAIDRHHLRFNEVLRVHQDSDFIIKLAYYCYLKSGIIDRPVAMRGIHDDNRITKIVKYSPQYNQRQSLFWNSLYEWSKPLSMDKDVSQLLYLQKKAFELSGKKGFSKAISLLGALLKNPDILKTKYRFTYLNS
ncbi:glycosyltransferase family 2 protein [Chryseobacterium indologenes]|uniref:glycosyltransferase family 2 protein n=1 Tax=Chryseobacterium indologenes TaxID=253 RepID=UPI000F4D315E|nr:glycosyltransferase family 2 protein [Chryseobacterium indologenes]AYZ37517.1 glycosyltransferase family 2 protein [Chryseobacterium indologenes]MBF6646389.1 glycosyltransferase family 2 protein [Chryseobacterium indologenes]MBU3048293.1 glycosyltransferase family 2 protein [Chryseobacterium indologenes]MEB4761887.1 glycosyltransferase family 2 protein [Chryseobacterium indologenes]QQQ69940.1 glycosyltransferase family 2 protein [Chryseobacterium indologenes]